MHVSVVDSFFLGGGTVVVAAGTLGVVNGLVVTDNTWENYNMGSNVTVVVDERNNNTFAHPPTDMIMAGNVGSSSMAPRAITVTKSLHQAEPSTVWAFDFGADFVFPSLPILNVQYSIEIAGGNFARHASRPPSGPTGQQVTVETDVPVVGTVTVTATQGIFTVGNR